MAWTPRSTAARRSASQDVQDTIPNTDKVARKQLSELFKTVTKYITIIWAELKKDNLGKRIFKCTLATFLTLILCLCHPIVAVYGKAIYLAPIATVFGHPGRRLGAMVETLVLAIIGVSIGVGVVCLATELSDLAYPHNVPAAYGIRGIFIALGLLVHGYIRSQTPRLFIMVLLMILPILIGMTMPVFRLTSANASNYFYPVFTAGAISLLVNITIFPESGSSYLAKTTIASLDKTVKVLKDATALFLKTSSEFKLIEKKSSDEDSSSTRNVTLTNRAALKALVNSKTGLRAALTLAKTVIKECSFELAFSCLPPRALKPISSKGLEKLVSNTVALVGACESKYALLGLGSDSVESKVANSDGPVDKIKRTKARREIEFGDEALLRLLVSKVEKPLNTLMDSICRSVDILKECIELAYHVSNSHDKALAGRHPKGILLQELDIHITTLADNILHFDGRSRTALENTSLVKEISEHELDLLPREELFVVSSFLLNLRLAAQQALEMLQHGRSLVEQHQERKGRRKFHAPKIALRKWLSSGGEENETYNGAVKSAIDRFHHENKSASDEKIDSAKKTPRQAEKSRQAPSDNGDEDNEEESYSLRLREKLADSLEWFVESSNVRYAFRLTIGVMLVTWPALIASFGEWYYRERGVWVAIIFILVFEDAVGSTILIFGLRTLGTIIGSAWGYAAWTAGDGNPFVIAVMLTIGICASFYVQLGTKYVKAGMVSTISMSVVAISTRIVTVPGSALENFAKRSVAMLVGGAVAVLVQVIFYPVKARTRLVMSLGIAVLRINEMESAIAYGVDERVDQKLDIKNAHVVKKFNAARKKADASLAAATAFLLVTNNEPRLKGSYESHRLAFTQIIFVLRQIMERMENMLQLRLQHGSAVLEDLYSQVYTHRRNVAASITITLFAVHEALTTKMPLPQFFPSARLAHLRMVNRVREVLLENARATDFDDTKHKVLRLNFMSWNAASAALEEAIEYIEELVDLTKLLVGASEFRSGLLYRPTYREYVKKIRLLHHQSTIQLERMATNSTEGSFDGFEVPYGVNGDGVFGLGGMNENHNRVEDSMHEDTDEEIDDDLPQPLQRVQTRLQDARLARQLSRTSSSNSRNSDHQEVRDRRHRRTSLG